MNRRSSDEAEDEDHGITGGSRCRHWQGAFSPCWLGHRWDNRVSSEDPAVELQRCVRAAATVLVGMEACLSAHFVSRTLRLQRYRRQFTVPRIGVMKDNSLRYRASKHDCGPCPLKPRCCPNLPARKVPRSIYEGARDLAREIAKTEAYQTSRYQRKKVEMLFAHLKRILKLDRLMLRGPCGARDEFHLAAIAQNLRKLAKLIPAPQ